MPIVKLPRKRLIAMDKNNITIDMSEKKHKLSKREIDILKKLRESGKIKRLMA